MRTVVASLAMVAMLALFAGAAYAKPTADEAQAAREHYKRGTTLYDLGKYDEAIIEFQQAYEIKDDPVLLYNIAQSFRLANKYNEALRFYRTYLRKSPKAPNRDEVETKIADMENLIAQTVKVATAPSVDAIPPKGDKPASIGQIPARTETPPARAETPRARAETPPARTETPPARTETPPDRTEVGTETRPDKTEAKTETPPGTPPATAEDTGAKPGRGKLIGGIVIAVVGVAALGAGLGLGFTAQAKGKTQETAMVYDPALESSGKLFGTVGLVLDVVGGVALAAGVVVAVLGATAKPEAQKVTFAPAVGPGSAGAILRLQF